MRQRKASWSVEDLDVFQRAYRLSIELHRASLGFPKIEQFGGLADQLRRASKSICSLIAEGAGRQQSSSREFVRYLAMAIGSAEETRLWCSYCLDLGYADSESVKRWRDECGHIIRMLQGLKSSVVTIRPGVSDN